MKSVKDIKQSIRKLKVESSDEIHGRVVGKLLRVLDKSKKQTAVKQPKIWRIIAKSPMTKFAVAAVIIIAVLIGVNMLKGTPAWAIGQSIKALENIETAIVSGEFTDGRTTKFTLHIKGEKGDWSSFRGYGESDESIVMVRNKIVYMHWRGSREIYSYNLEDSKGKGIATKLWYEAIKNAPWIAPIAPTMLEAAKVLTSDWEEVYKRDEQTERDCVSVTGSYEPLSTSFQIVFDLETKLIVRAKYWANTSREGMPGLDIKKVVYNEEVSDEIFDLEQYTGAIVVNEEEMEKRKALWREGVDLGRKKQYGEAIRTYQQLYDKYPQFIKTPEALVLIACCYRAMGEYNKAIEYFEKVPREYSAPRYAILDAYRLLGRCCMVAGQYNKALEAFDKCLELIGEWDPEGVRWKKAKELIEKDVRKINNTRK